MPKTLRQEKVNSFLKNLIAETINKEIDLPNNCLVTVTTVDVAPDLTQANVFISVLPIDQQIIVIGKIVRSRKALQKEVAKKFKSKHIPILTFVADSRGEKASQISSLLDEI